MTFNTMHMIAADYMWLCSQGKLNTSQSEKQVFHVLPLTTLQDG